MLCILYECFSICTILRQTIRIDFADNKVRLIAPRHGVNKNPVGEIYVQRIWTLVKLEQSINLHMS